MPVIIRTDISRQCIIPILSINGSILAYGHIIIMINIKQKNHGTTLKSAPALKQSQKIPPITKYEYFITVSGNFYHSLSTDQILNLYFTDHGL